MTSVVYPYQILFLLVAASSRMVQGASRSLPSGRITTAFDPCVLELVLKVEL